MLVCHLNVRRTFALIFALTIASVTVCWGGPLEEANRLFEEKSYALALKKYDEILATSSTQAIAREALCRKAECLIALHENAAAERTLSELEKSAEEDRWTAIAAWKLAYLAGQRGLSPEDTSQTLARLDRAERILSVAAPSLLTDLYRDVVRTIAPQVPWGNVEWRVRFLPYYDKLIAKLKDPNEIAEAHWAKAQFRRGLQEPDSERQWLDAMRMLVREFPDTAVAPRAQAELARHVQASGKLAAALAEWKRLLERWPQSEEARQAREEIRAITLEYVSITPRQFQVSPNERIELLLQARNLHSVSVALYRVSPKQLLEAGDPDNFNLSVFVSGTPVLRKEVQLPIGEDYRPTTTSVVLQSEATERGERLPKGLYVVAAQGGNASAYHIFAVSELLLVTKPAGQRLDVWSVDATTGRPIAGVEISLRGSGKQAATQSKTQRLSSQLDGVQSVRSDGNGLASFSIESRRGALIVARFGEDIAFVSLPAYATERWDSRNVAYVYTDRPVYRPTEKVGWKAIIRVQREGKYENLAGQTFRVEVTDSRGARVLQDEFVANEFGTISGEVALGQQAPLGVYHIHVSDRATRTHGYASFRVEEYKKPEYEVRVSTVEKIYKVGSTIQARVQAQYYFGAPVANAHVRYEVRRQPRWWWMSYERIAQRGQDLPDWFESERADQRVKRRAGGAEIVATGEGSTDEKGTFEFEFTAEAVGKGQKIAQSQFESYEFVIEATVTDASRRAISGATSAIVGEKALVALVSAERSIYVPGETVKARIATRNLRGDSVASSGTLYVEKLQWDPATEKDLVTTIVEERIRVPAEGEWVYAWRAPEGQAGRYRILYIADDPFGGTSSGKTEITIADPFTRDIQVRYQGIQLVLDKGSYQPGEVARVLVLSEWVDAHAWLWVDTGTGHIEQKVLPLRYRTTFVELPITEAFVPNSELHVIMVRDKHVFRDSKEIIVPPTRQVLNIHARFDRDSYRPRQRGVLRLEAKTWDGKPVEGEFSVAIYDKALEYIADSFRPDIRSVFYGKKRYLHSYFDFSYNELQKHGLSVPPPTQYDVIYQNEYESPRRAIGRAALSERKMLAAAPTMARSEAEAVPASAAMDMAKEEGGAPLVRRDFRDRILWQPVLKTNSDGLAEIEVAFPDSLTTWKADVVGVTQSHLVGNVTTETIVEKKILVRLETPRFVRERDELTISANVHNYLTEAQRVRVSLDADGLTWSSTEDERTTVVEIEANGARRVDWRLRATAVGPATLRAEARNDAESDAMEVRLPVLPHGIDRIVVRSGSTLDLSSGTRTVVRNSKETIITEKLHFPVERIRATSKVQVTIAPSIAATIRQALPYLIEYPYGCVEQTMSRFLPAVIAAKAFEDLGIPRDPYLSEKLPDVLRAGWQRLADFQRPDGSWGWWKDGPADAYMSAHVMYGLTLARQADVGVAEDVFQRGLAFIKQDCETRAKRDPAWRSDWRSQRDLHTLAYEAFVLALNGQRVALAEDLLWRSRESLSPTGLAMFARTLWRAGKKTEAETVLRNLMNFAVPTEENSTVHFERRGSGAWYCYWWNDNVEATAYALEAFLEIAPSDETLHRAMKWLVLNRQGRQWKSSKDTGLAVLALTAYLRTHREDQKAADIEVSIGDGKAQTFAVTPQNFYSAEFSTEIEGDAIPDGELRVRIRVLGEATVFYVVSGTYYSLEEPIPAAGHEVFVERLYERRLRPNEMKSRATTETSKQPVYVPLQEGETIQSGDRLRVQLRLRALNDYEYIVVEDPKPAGCEPVEVRSGWQYFGTTAGNVEFRDQWVAFLLSEVRQGDHTLTYEYDAQIPGVFHTMPSRAYGMYVPVLRANSKEDVLRITDKAADVRP